MAQIHGLYMYDLSSGFQIIISSFCFLGPTLEVSLALKPFKVSLPTLCSSTPSMAFTILLLLLHRDPSWKGPSRFSSFPWFFPGPVKAFRSIPRMESWGTHKESQQDHFPECCPSHTYLSSQEFPIRITHPKPLIFQLLSKMMYQTSPLQDSTQSKEAKSTSSHTFLPLFLLLLYIPQDGRRRLITLSKRIPNAFQTPPK